MLRKNKTLYVIHRHLPNHFRIAILTSSLLLLSLLQSHERAVVTKTPYNTQAIAQMLESKQVAVLAETTEVNRQKASQVQVLEIEEKKNLITPTQPQEVMGRSKQVDEHTWTITVEKDERNATAGEIHQALNAYRQKNGRSGLQNDDRLSSFAQSRAEYFTKEGRLDSHKGFQDFITNDGFNKVGFFALGENSSYGYVLEGTHLIEWVYAGDKPHDDNQLSNDWTHVGIGVSGTATNLIFGGKKQ